MSRLPLPLLHACGTMLGWSVYLYSSSYRKRMRKNLASAGYSAQRRRAIAESGKAMKELPFIWYGTPTRVMARTQLENWDLVQDALAEGKGLIFLTPHLGSFEVSAQAVAHSIPLMVLYRPPRKAIFKPLLEEARARPNLDLAPANLTGVRMLAKRLKKGMAIGMLPDQVPQQGEGVWADFFGKPAYTMTLPAKLHAMTGAPIITAWAERLSWGRGFKVHFARLETPLNGTPTEQAQAINAAMEALIANNPAQYLWSYNRYKQPSAQRSLRKEPAPPQ